MTDANFFVFLARALDALASEVPAASSALARTLSGIDLYIHVDGEAHALRVFQQRCVLSTVVARCGAELRTQRAVLVALLEARTTLLAAVSSDALMLRGAPDDLANVYDALSVFIRGAVRSTSIPSLFEAYLADDSPEHYYVSPTSEGRANYERRT